tara:strand:+ start:974 stop:1753 length:780 start_codon:yes stop_codon:yes gene_type:complete
MRSLLIVVFVVLFSSVSLTASEDWGKTGHRTMGEIAAKHLSKRAAKKISALLGGESLAFVSTYADEIRSDDAYRKYGPWHYVNFPFGGRYENTPKNKKGDIIVGIQNCIDVLKDATSSQKDKEFYLRLLVHFIGDLHMPLHVGLKEDKGGNSFKVKWFGKQTNLHSVWDTKIIEGYGMSFTELTSNVDALSKKEIQTIQSGAVTDWMYESRALCEDVYANTSVGENLGYKYMYRYVNVSRKQLQKAGLRLASILNEIYG